MSKAKTWWTVLLLRPDYMTNEYGIDTYMTHIKAANAKAAVKAAQTEACNTDQTLNPADYYPLITLEGKHMDVTPAVYF